MTKAAGILYGYEGSVLLLKRAKDGMWGFPGGHIEDGETPIQAAIRECEEEMGSCPNGTMQWSLGQRSGDVDYTTFYETLDSPFTPVLNDEHTEFGWFPSGELPYPIIQGAADAIARITMDELEVAAMIAQGRFTSPQRFRNIYLFAIRITGTGLAYRAGQGPGGNGEFTFRPPAEWVTPEFLQRCNGLPVILDHPDAPILNSSEFSERIVGTIFYPYAKDDEVWGIAKIYNDETKKMLVESQWSTSPGVLVSDDDTIRLPLESGETLLYEGAPFLLDHIAICKRGVWDKYGAPKGVETTLIEENMADKEDRREEDRQDSEKVETVSKVDSEAETEKTDKKDAECMEDKKDTDELANVKAEMAEIKSLLKSIVGSKSDKKDSEKEDEKKDEEDKDDKKDATEEFVPGEPLDAKADKKDAADKDEEKSRRDAEAREMRARIDAVDRRTRELSDAERDEISDAQSRCDSVAMMHGESAPRPQSGESALAYRRRAVSRFKSHSSQWAGVDLSGLPADVFKIAESAIYHDAEAAAHAPVARGAEQVLREVKSKTEQGHSITRFRGPAEACWGEFKR